MTRYKYMLKIFISLVLLSYFIYRTNLHDIFTSMSNVPTYVFSIALILDFFGIIINTIKWSILLHNQSFCKLFKLNLITQYYSQVLPGQFSGLLVKVCITEKQQCSIEEVAASVIADKATGIIALLGLASIGICLSSSAISIEMRLTIIFFFITGIFCTCFFKVPLIGNKLLLFSKIIVGKYAFLAGFDRFLKAWRSYSITTLLISLLFSFCYQILCLVVIVVIAANLSIDVNIVDWCWLFGVLAVTLFLPISIAGIGVRELTLVGLLGFLSISSDKAMALSFYLLAVNLFIAGVGGICEVVRIRQSTLSPDGGKVDL